MHFGGHTVLSCGPIVGRGHARPRTIVRSPSSVATFVVALATAVLIPHASPGGNAGAIAREVVASGKPLATFDELDNQSLLDIGATPLNLDADILPHTAGRRFQATKNSLALTMPFGIIPLGIQQRLGLYDAGCRLRSGKH